MEEEVSCIGFCLVLLIVLLVVLWILRRKPSDEKKAPSQIIERWDVDFCTGGSPRHPPLEMRNGRRRYQDIVSERPPRPTLDLHYMTLLEAKQWTRYFLEAMKGRGRALIITGRGVRARNGPVLHPRIKSYLKGQGIPFVASDDNGSLTVFL